MKLSPTLFFFLPPQIQLISKSNANNFQNVLASGHLSALHCRRLAQAPILVHLTSCKASSLATSLVYLLQRRHSDTLKVRSSHFSGPDFSCLCFPVLRSCLCPHCPLCSDHLDPFLAPTERQRQGLCMHCLLCLKLCLKHCLQITSAPPSAFVQISPFQPGFPKPHLKTCTLPFPGHPILLFPATFCSIILLAT